MYAFDNILYTTNVKPWNWNMLKESAILLCLHRIICDVYPRIIVT